MSHAKMCAFVVGAGLLLARCGGSGGEGGVNPFLEDMDNPGKEDTGYVNPDGIEVEVDLEADVEASSYRIAEAPAELGQFALTYFRKRGEFYIESLAEDATSSDRVEWLVDGSWIGAAAAREVDAAKLRRFRIRAVNAVLLFDAAEGAKEGSVFTAKVPLKPYSIMADAGNTCADPDGHMTLDQSIYWYMWNPDKQGCKVAVQDMTVTIARLLPSRQVTYPEYDRLVADGKITAVILFGKIGDGAINDREIGVQNFKEMARWLKEGGFKEATPAPVGKRFSRQVGTVEVVVDIYGPADFEGLSDMAHFSNFQKAIGEHEIVAYDGHSMLGASDFWSRPQYPAFYQVFLYGGCLGYEYYVRPILAGKGGWDKVDIVSSVVEVTASANDFAAPFLSKMIWALQNGYKASWKDMLATIRSHVGDSTFGASGVRDNCFSPAGSLCTPDNPAPGTEKRYENNNLFKVPDDDPAGAVSLIEVGDAFTAKTVTVEIDVTHTWVGDLVISVEHGGATAVLWDKEGNDSHDVVKSFNVAALAGKEASGVWKLRVVDAAAQDEGTLNRWGLVLVP